MVPNETRLTIFRERDATLMNHSTGTPSEVLEPPRGLNNEPITFAAETHPV
jgi:hypothetical protein